jgi:hypothetical protein
MRDPIMRDPVMRRRRFASWLAMATVSTVGGFAPAVVATDAARADTAPAAGTPASVSADGLPTWQVNGVVWSQAVVGDTVYVTGNFTKARPPGVEAGGAGEVSTGNVFAYDITTGDRVASFKHSLNGQGLTVAASPDGSRVYVGGDFTAVDGHVRGHVAAFDTRTNALSPTFRPRVNSKVQALAVGPTTVYLGGTFQAVDGSLRKNLGAVSASDGALLAWAPKAEGGYVGTMVVAPDQSRVIVGGSFTTLNSRAAYGMGSLDAEHGAVLPWAANTTIRDATEDGAITSLRTDGRQIYGSGYVYGIGANFEGTFAAEPTTGRITVVNDCHGDTYDVLPVAGVLYSAGHAHDCQWVHSFGDTRPRVRWQYLLAQTTDAKTTNTGPDSYRWNYKGLPASAVLHWFPQLTAGTFTGQTQAAWSLAGNASYVAVGGEFLEVNRVAQQGLVRMAVAAEAPNRRGPTYNTRPARPIPATVAGARTGGRVRVTFGTAWDYDNRVLTYDVFRDSDQKPFHTARLGTTFWQVPSKTIVDSGLQRGSQHTYRIRIRDAFGNTIFSPTSNVVTVR